MLERVSRLFGRSSSFHRDEAVSEDPIETLSAEPEDPVAADGPQVVTDERTIRENGWKPIEVDRAYPWFEPQHGLYVDGAPVIPYRADTVIDAWSTKHFTVRAATVRGYGHRFNKRHEPRQDDFALGIHDPSETLFIRLVAE